VYESTKEMWDADTNVYWERPFSPLPLLLFYPYN